MRDRIRGFRADFWRLTRPEQLSAQLRLCMWPDSSQTQELLERARAGEAPAVNALLDRHREALRRMIDLRMDRAIQQRVDASDIVQDVLVEANRRRSRSSGQPGRSTAAAPHRSLRQLSPRPLTSVRHATASTSARRSSVLKGLHRVWPRRSSWPSIWRNCGPSLRVPRRVGVSRPSAPRLPDRPPRFCASTAR